VRVTAIAALGKQHATAQAPLVRERLDDTKEDPEVRAFAARTLGAMCVQNAADRLTKLAYLARAPVDEADDRIGIAAIEALGALHPHDLEARLAPLRGKDVRMPVRRAAERALLEPTSCR
jgi:HEAT repeat protein